MVRDETPDLDAKPEPLRRVVLGIDDLRLTRKRGPAEDNLPREITVDGRVVLDEETGLDLSDLVIGLDGGSLSVDGGLDKTLTDLRTTTVKLRSPTAPTSSAASINARGSTA